MTTLKEDKRHELISRGRRGDKEKDGKSRYEKRVNSRVASTVKEMNQIDMESLFKYSLLTINVPVQGETDNYLVRIKFGGFLEELHKQLQFTNSSLTLKMVVQALVRSFDREDVYISCSCPDWRYRGAFWASMSKITSGAPETRPSKITNPHNSLGPGCKHIMLVLSNNKWVMKAASTIFNYITYMEKNRKQQYADIIYPAIYDKKYGEPVQLSLDDNDALSSDAELVNTANAQGRVRGQFKTGNPYRYQRKPGPGVGQIPIQDDDEET